jgi:ParB family transcriptional regulator, chromosome partitioning protein
MQLEFHQLDRRWEHLRVHHPQRQRRLLASLAESGQQIPIVVVAAAGRPDRYLVIDGYRRIAALQQLGRDIVEAVVWPLSDVEALLLDRSLRPADKETALEQGWLLAELEQRFGYGLEELARRFDRSVGWVSRRLALVERTGNDPTASARGQDRRARGDEVSGAGGRINLEDGERMAAIFAQHHCESRQAGQSYAAWRNGSAAIRKRILDAPDLFFKTQRQTEVKTEAAAGAPELFRDLQMVVAIVNRAHRRLAGAAVTEMDVRNAKRCCGRPSKRAINWDVWRSESKRSEEHMLSQVQRSTILELHTQWCHGNDLLSVVPESCRSIARLLQATSTARSASLMCGFRKVGRRDPLMAWFLRSVYDNAVFRPQRQGTLACRSGN